MKKTVHKLSAQKLSALRKELEILKTKGRAEITSRLAAVQHETIEELENPFIAINEDKFFLEDKIAEIEVILKESQVTDGKEEAECSCVAVGSTVKVAFESFEETYTLVDPIEADPLEKMISIESPVGQALLGKEVGETVVVDIAGIKKTFKIKKIS